MTATAALLSHILCEAGQRLLELTKGKFAIVDEADYDRVAAFKWTATNNPSRTPGATEKWYAVRQFGGKRIYLHRFVLDYDGSRVVDHLDGNGLNCTRANLQITTQKQNVRRTYASFGGWR